jgi:hypothetical protein
MILFPHRHDFKKLFLFLMWLNNIFGEWKSTKKTILTAGIISITICTAILLSYKRNRKGTKNQASVIVHEKDGVIINEIVLKSEKARVSIINYGATIKEFQIFKQDGDMDVVLGYDDPFDYIEDSNNPYFGAIIGRSCNRTAFGQFVLNGLEYNLPINNGPNSLHGGTIGFSKCFWNYEIMERLNSVTFTLISPHLDQGSIFLK